jgi:L-amino acid N-acyltransferase YncA
MLATMTGVAVKIRPLRGIDWPDVARIYAAGIETGNATFETTTPSWEAWDSSHLEGHRLVALQEGQIVGWSALAPVSRRACYAGVAEDSVYVAPEAQGRGVGRALLERLIVDSERAGIWTIQTGIFPENEASLSLHRRCGFRVVGVRVALAQLHGAWRDVVFMERRSAVIR